ncbi:glycosyltransferase family protein [Paenibacillus chungangensis]|uniref:Glycosyltransferase n=1 Tax=Paenibacillus chungangensis TaxID=696535 RepID=A0ABW3HWF3_9BACL
MDIRAIDNRLYQIKAFRDQLKKEILGDVSSHADFELIKNDRKFPSKFSTNKSIKVACIMDEFTFHSFEPECNLLQITPSNWKSQLEQFEPDLFFIESAWKGIQGLWNGKVAHLGEELIEAVNYCKIHQIPVVFWNKEDPVHFDTFIATAKYADFVFTTDIDCISKYKTYVEHQQVYLLPFAAQTKYHNPIEAFERKDAFCFAGAYYKRYPERIRDLDAFLDVISEKSQLDIFDRNFYNNDPQYAFPKKYNKYIEGNLKPQEIDKAYKGYRFNVNMNSVKQSQSMCARRVFELLASNTVTVSNYSRAIRNIFGDLVVCTDDKQQLTKEINKFIDESYYKKYRLAGLRKTLNEHTYSHRLNYIIEQVFQKEDVQLSKSVAVLTTVHNVNQLNYIMYQFNRQTYENKTLYLFAPKNTFNNHNHNHNFFKHITTEVVQKIKDEHDAIVFFSPQDYYGENYILDFTLTELYSKQNIFTKHTYYNHDSDQFNYNIGVNYRETSEACIRKSYFSTSKFSSKTILAYWNDIEHSIIESTALSIDEFNYCMNFTDNHCEVVDDLILFDTGINLPYLLNMATEITPFENETRNYVITSGELESYLSSTELIRVKSHDRGVYLESALPRDHFYLYLNKIISTGEIGLLTNKLDIYIEAEYLSRFSLEITIIGLDQKGNKTCTYVKPINKKVSVEIATNTHSIKLGLRISGQGTCIIKKIIMGEIHHEQKCVVSKSDTLLLTDHYPSYQDLYRYAFIHSRMRAYKENGKLVDMFKLNERLNSGFSEFESIDIKCGDHEDLVQTLNFGNYNTLLIHFLTKKMWDTLKPFRKNKKIIVWVHGAEIQPWWRRQFNYSNKSELEAAKAVSVERLDFWKNIFTNTINEDVNFHFVFVSDYFANEVFQDLGMKLPSEKYSVIHNYINSDLFNYSAKSIEKRKKIISIRPFTSAKYANDLTVKAIQELSKEAFFNDIEFRIIGRGELFNKTVKPLMKYRNVQLDESFIRQSDMPLLFEEYGVFLNPTRWDSQGVSRDEAMASGLVPLTNAVSAIPEFVDDSCGILVDGEDYKGLAEGIKKLYENPNLFLELSSNAASRVRRQSGKQETITKEIQLIDGHKYK